MQTSRNSYWIHSTVYLFLSYLIKKNPTSEKAKCVLKKILELKYCDMDMNTTWHVQIYDYLDCYYKKTQLRVKN